MGSVYAKERRRKALLIRTAMSPVMRIVPIALIRASFFVAREGELLGDLGTFRLDSDAIKSLEK
jgi:hypothetical protein